MPGFRLHRLRRPRMSEWDNWRYAKEAAAVIMKHHGVITFGKDLKEALYSAVYLEEAAKTYCMARIMGPVPELSEAEIAKEAAGWTHYGQSGR